MTTQELENELIRLKNEFTIVAKKNLDGFAQAKIQELVTREEFRRIKYLEDMVDIYKQVLDIFKHGKENKIARV